MKKSIKIIHWIPRVLCILAILFISMFALDAFRPELTFWQQLGGFMMHLIPSFVLLALLVVAWKWELIGGIIFTLIGLVMSPIIYTHNYNMNQSISMSLIVILSITFPFIVVGVLFIVGHFMKKKEASKN